MSESIGAGRPAGREPSPLGRKLAVAGLTLAILGAVFAIASGLGYRIGLWHFRIGFKILEWASYGAIAAAVISIAALIVSRAKNPAVLTIAVLGLLIGLVTAYIPWSYKKTVASLPYIHDITTDIQNPPQLIAAAKLRKPDDHPVAYDGAEIGAEQKEAYPDIVPFVTKASKDQVFQAAESALKDMRVEIVDTNAAEGRLEAVDTTLLFGFKDDMVVRIQQAGENTRVDVRSKSRVGRSDLGKNAKRIRTFMTKLQHALPAG
jgi:uncharacterized protein (DUF1499 family)